MINMVIPTRSVSAAYLRNFIFGVEDSLVSTVGLLSGVAIAGMEPKNILITGSILIFVEAFSMAVGSFLSEHSAEGYIHQAETPIKNPFINGIIMFFSYFISGFIPLFPYAIININKAFWISVILSLAALFLLGVIGAKISKINLWRGGFRMSVIGGIAIAIGVAVGQIANNL